MVKIAPATVISADPPWRFGDRLPGSGRGAAKNYKTMTVDEICAFELPPIADDALLFLWRVSAMVEEAYRVVFAWGFTPKSEVVWQKATKDWKPWFGMGRYVRASHETCIIATRGRPKVLVRNIRSRFSAQVPVDSHGRYIHSGKPEVFYTKIVEALSAGPYVEIFGRRQRPGWTVLGNQAHSRW